MPLPLPAPEAGSIRRRPRKQAWVVAGVVLVILGVTLGIIPVVPGTPLTLLGLALASAHSPRVRLARQKTQVWLFAKGIRLRLSRRKRRRVSLAMSPKGADA